MRILMLTPYLPYPLLSGGQIRTYNLIKKLSKIHEITLFALIKTESERQYIKHLQPYCKKIKAFKRSEKPFTISNILRTAVSSYPFLVIRNYVTDAIKEIKIELQNHEYDLIHAETFYMMPHLPQTIIPTILVEQTIEYLGYESYAKNALPVFRTLLNIDIKKIRRWERYYWRRCDKLIVMSNEDKNFIASIIKNPAKIEVVSNGVDSQWFKNKKRKNPKQPTILFVGTFKWLPNVEAVNYLVKKIWPLIKNQISNAKLWIVGNAPTQQIQNYQHQDQSIKVSGQISDIRDAFKQAHILIAPVLSGKGTRYKILEAMASETPVVGTKTAVEGLAVRDKQEVLISNSAQGLAKMTIQILQNKNLRRKLAQNAFNFVSKNYDWDLIAKKLDKVYKTMGKKYE